MKTYYVYILTNFTYTVLYVGMTNDLQRRVFEHKRGKYEKSFTKRYRIDRLVYFEQYSSFLQARAREVQIKNWTRRKKERLIKIKNPQMIELCVDDS